MLHRVLVLGLTSLLVGCATAIPESSTEYPVRYEVTAQLDAAAASPMPKDAAGKSALAAPEATSNQVQVVQRQVIYSAALRLVVVSTVDAMASVNGIAKDLEGYLQESSGNAIAIRVPAGRFEEAIARIVKLGEVVDRSVKAADVTEEMFDINLRIDNARKTRDRLLAHLDKSDKLEDTLKLEVEIRRLSGEIEQMEGRLRFMQSQIAMSTIRVELNTNSPKPMAGGDRLGVPFPWVARLGSGLVAGSVESMPRQPKILDRGPTFTPPPGFVRYYSSRELVEALNPDGLRITVQRHQNFDRASLAFWLPLARRSLVETRSLADVGVRDEQGGPSVIEGTREVAGERYAYVLGMLSDNNYVWTFEAWGAVGAFGPQRDAIFASVKSLKK